LIGENALAYYAHLKFAKKINCFEYDPRGQYYKTFLGGIYAPCGVFPFYFG